ncbi:hypothetical protein BH09SUM1_BH09SUM1_34090 [soil metagenome]
MKFKFQAIDDAGRVVRGVLRAESAADAREMLLEENCFAKTLDEVGEDEKLTWAPRERIKRRAQEASSHSGSSVDTTIRASSFQTTAVRGFSESTIGKAGLTEAGAFAFHPRGEGAEPLLIAAEQIEQASVTGFPARVLRIVLLSGKSYEFSAGYFVANSVAKSIAAHFS